MDMSEREFATRVQLANCSQKKPFNRKTIEGSKAISEELQRRYTALMAKTPKERYDYLANKGWTRLSMERKDNNRILVIWRVPDNFPEDLTWRVELCQTKAIETQLYKDMLDEKFCEVG